MTGLYDLQTALVTALETIYSGVEVKRGSPRIFPDAVEPPVIFLTWNRELAQDGSLGRSLLSEDFSIAAFFVGEKALLDAIDTLNNSGLTAVTVSTVVHPLTMTKPERFNSEGFAAKADYGFTMTISILR